MYAAHNNKGEVVYAVEAHLQSNYYCPICKAIVHLKKSKKGRFYFAHRVACQSNALQSKRSYNETIYHQQAKSILYNACHACNLEVNVEYQLSDIKQIADIFVPSQRTIIEFQHSPISASELERRTLEYEKLGMRVIWLTDVQNKFRSSWRQTLLRYSQADGLYWLEMNLEKQTIIQYTHLPILYTSKEYAYGRREQSVMEWVKQGFQMQNEIQIVKHRQRQRLNYQRQLLQLINAPLYQEILRELYKYDVKLLHLPQWIISEKRQSMLTKSPAWVVLAWVYTAFLQVGATFTTQEVRRFIKDKLEYVQTPFIEGDVVYWVAHAALRIYEQYGMIKHTTKQEWYKL